MEQKLTAKMLAKGVRHIATEPMFREMENLFEDLDLTDIEDTKRKLAERNAAQLAMDEQNPLQPDGKIVAPASGSQPAVDMYVYYPKERREKLPVIYFQHASGYLIGNARQDSQKLFDLANDSGAVVVSVEYRMAGQAPFPADLDDAYHGLAYIFDHADEFGFDSDKVIIMGESAGGGLTARLTLKLRDMGRYHIKGQILSCPMLDYRTGSSDSLYHNPYAGEFVWKPRSNQNGWQMLRGGQDIPADQMPYYSASMATDLSGLPPTFIAVGSLDLFVNENIDYAQRLITAGVPTDLLVLNGYPHGMEVLNPDAPESKRYLYARKQIIKTMLEED